MEREEEEEERVPVGRRLGAPEWSGNGSSILLRGRHTQAHKYGVYFEIQYDLHILIDVSIAFAASPFSSQ